MNRLKDGDIFTFRVGTWPFHYQIRLEAVMHDGVLWAREQDV